MEASADEVGRILHVFSPKTAGKICLMAGLVIDLLTVCVSFYKMSSIPSIVEQWRVPLPLAKRVEELVFPLVVHTPKSLELS